MTDEATESAIRDDLNEILKPYRQQHKYREKVIALITKCMRSVEKEDYFSLDELLNTKLADEIIDIPELAECEPLFAELKADANEQIEHYRIQFIEDLQIFADEVELPIDIDFPHFSILPGIEGEIHFAERKTRLNKKTIKTIDPQRIVATALKLTQHLYNERYDPQTFINNIFTEYKAQLKLHKKKLGSEIPMQDFYQGYVMRLQAKTFFQDMNKAKFRGYEIDQFAVDIWRYFESGIGDVEKKYALALRPGRNNALWLLDSQGEKRQITSIAFQERK